MAKRGGGWNQSAFESGPPDDDEETTDKPVGVKEGYAAQRDGVKSVGDTNENGSPKSTRYGYSEIRPAQYDQPATFYESDIDRPGSQSPERIAQLQASLVQAGLLKAGSFRLGVWDTPTRNAYKEVLAHANRTGLTSADESLGAFLAAPTMGDESQRAPFRAELPNPDDMRKQIDKIATETIGRGISAEEREVLVKAYSAIIEKTQRTAYDTAETGGTVTEAPSFDTYTENEIRRLRPVESGAKDMANLSEQFLAAIRSTPGESDRVF